MCEIGNRIISIRQEKNLTQNQLADILRITRAHLGNLETGRRTPNAQTIRLMCLELGVNESWLLTGKGDPYSSASALHPQELIRLYESLSPALRRCALEQLRALAAFQRSQEEP